ncbi:60S ribosomal export protein NMD3 [Natronomonas amylolytica]|uniref:60S ribosomal export protein NMD3 n=1 Tax=Natronomonas amylolytica TaxID=3108498 RepID=UPI0030095309
MSSGSRSEEFCPRCGDAIERPPEVDLPTGPRDPDSVLCDDCYFEDFDLVDAPERIEVRVCSQCGALHRGNRWIDVGARDYTDIAIEETAERLAVHVDAHDVDWGVEPEQVDQNTIRMHAVFTGVIRDTPLQEKVTVPVYIARETCDRCGRIAGDYYASTIQVRGTERTPSSEEQDRAIEIAEEFVADREEDGDREAFITETTEMKDGVNMKVSTNKLGQTIAERIVRELGGAVSEAPTLVTEDGDGNEVYRVTFTARLPPYTPGDVIDLEDGDGPVLVTSAHGNLKGTRLESGDRYEADFEEGIAPDARKLGTREDAETTTVVAIEDAHAVQVLDPETYEAKTIPRPDYVDPDADEVPVLKHRDGLHILPE